MRENKINYGYKNSWENPVDENFGCVYHRYLCIDNPYNNFLGNYSHLGNQSYLVSNYLATGYLDNGRYPTVQLNVRYNYQYLNNYKCNRCIKGICYKCS